jgi:hypothetical protein
MNLQELYTLDESSGYSLEGSFTPDLVFSKYWLMAELDRIQSKYSVAYVLGSWYGNLAIYLLRYQRPQVEKIINVETNQEFLSASRRLINVMGMSNVEHMLRDANKLDYGQLDDQGVVINTSLNDMSGQAWFERIPSGTMVAMQARDRNAGQKFARPEDITAKFPLSQVLYSGSLELQDPETRYTRFMVIGTK